MLPSETRPTNFPPQTPTFAAHIALRGDSKRSITVDCRSRTSPRVVRYLTSDPQASNRYNSDYRSSHTKRASSNRYGLTRHGQNVTTAAKWRACNAKVRTCLSQFYNLQYPGSNFLHLHIIVVFAFRYTCTCVVFTVYPLFLSQSLEPSTSSWVPGFVELLRPGCASIVRSCCMIPACVRACIGLSWSKDTPTKNRTAHSSPCPHFIDSHAILSMAGLCQHHLAFLQSILLVSFQPRCNTTA